MNQNKEQDFLDSPEFGTLLHRFAVEYKDDEDGDPDKAKESLKTFIREKMKVKECVSCDEHKPCHNICTECAVKLGKENIVFPTEEEIYNVAMNDMDASLDYQTGFVKGANTIIDRIKELNQLGN